MMKNTRGFAVVLLLALFAANLAFGRTALSAPSDAPVTGVFFIDYDRDGVIDPGEFASDSDPAFPPNGIEVTAYDSAGNSSAGTIIAGTPPTFSVSAAPLVGTQYRLEFALDPADLAAGWTETFRGADSASSTQFVTAGDEASFGITPPSSCPADAEGSTHGKLWTTCFVNGDRDAGGPQEVLVGLNYDTTGSVEAIGFKGDGNNATNSSAELGSVWGVAYDEWDSTLFTSALLKRQSDLGSEGLDGLYWATYPSGSWNSVSLDSLGGPSFGTEPARDIEGTSFDSPFYDIEAFGDVARIGIGDIDLTPDGQTLLVANLAAKAINVYDVSNAPAGSDPVFLRSIPVPNPGCSDTANPGDYEIWAISAIDGNTAYAGAVCTAENSAVGASDLEAHVINVNLSGSAGPSLLTIPLDYARGCAGTFDGVCLDPAGNGAFAVWDDVYDGFLEDDSPVFSDIEIAGDGSLVLGFFSRESHQVGAGNYPPIDGQTWLAKTNASGEILHACNVSGDPHTPSWVLEGPAGSSCDAHNNFPDPTGGDLTDGAVHAGPGGFAEWYGDDRRTYVTGNSSSIRSGHTETTLGGLYVNPYFDEVVTSSMDAFGWYTGGLAWMSTTTGQRSNQIDLYSGETDTGYLGKAAGIGDVEGCYLPMEIGDRVWLDLDGDGIQDPNETPLAGVTVVLRNAAGTVLGVATTDATGHYVFDSSDGIDATTSYMISIEPSTNTTPLPGGYTNADLTPTIQNAGSPVHDSNADADGKITFVTGEAGTNDHSLDAGFQLPTPEPTTTVPPTTEAPSTTAPATTVASTTVPPTTTPATTVPVTTTEAPSTTVAETTTVPPTTTPPTTTPPTTEPPATTEPPTTEAPATTAPLTTEAPTTTVEATTIPPTTVPPTTTPATTVAPTTEPPATTAAPTTAPPETVPPETTAAPTTVLPTTVPPTTAPPVVTTVPVVTAPPPPPPATVPPTAPPTIPPTTAPPDTAPPSTTVPPVDSDPLYSLGSLVWSDLDNDGIVDPGESGIANVTLELFCDEDGDGHPDDANNDGVVNSLDALESTTTDSTGSYMFMGLAPCDYVVGIPPAEWDEELASHLSSDPTSATPNDDVDNDDNGVPAPNGYVFSGILSLGGQEPTSDDPADAPDTFSNKSVDFGFWQPNFDLALRKTLADGTNSSPIGLGQTVTFTISILNQGDVPATGIGIIDYIPAGLGLVDSDWTLDADGNAIITLLGPLAPGATTTVDIDLRVETTAPGFFRNTAEITGATPTTADGSAELVTPTGDPIADVDSIPDAINADALADDQVDANPSTGDEDDHDLAVLNLANPAQPSLLAFTGLEPQALLRAAILLILLGVVLLQGPSAARKPTKQEH